MDSLESRTRPKSKSSRSVQLALVGASLGVIGCNPSMPGVPPSTSNSTAPRPSGFGAAPVPGMPFGRDDEKKQQSNFSGGGYSGGSTSTRSSGSTSTSTSTSRGGFGGLFGGGGSS